MTFEENGVIENILRNGDNTRNQQLSPFPTMFLFLSKTNPIIYVTFDLLSRKSHLPIWAGLRIFDIWFRVDSFTTNLAWLLKTLRLKPVENIVGKGENAGNQHFLLFPQSFLRYQKNFHHLSQIWIVVCKLFFPRFLKTDLHLISK